MLQDCYRKLSLQDHWSEALHTRRHALYLKVQNVLHYCPLLKPSLVCWLEVTRSWSAVTEHHKCHSHCFNFVPPAQPSYLLPGREPLYTQRGTKRRRESHPRKLYFLLPCSNTEHSWFPKQKPSCSKMSQFHLLIWRTAHCDKSHLTENNPKIFPQCFMTVLPAAQEKSMQGLGGCYSMDSPHTWDRWPNTCNFQRLYLLKRQNSFSCFCSIFSISLLIWFSLSCLILWLFRYQKSHSSCKIYFSNFFTQKGRLVFTLNLSCVCYQFPF